MMTKKKILIGSVFAALLMVSMPFISALQTQQVATSTTTTSVQSSSPTATNLQSINLAAVTNDVNLIKSIDPKTATPEQIIYVIRLGIDALRNLGYTAKAAEIERELPKIIDAARRPFFVCLFLSLAGPIFQKIADFFDLIRGGREWGFAWFFWMEFTLWAFGCDWLYNDIYGCNACEAAAGSITPMTSN